MKTSHTFKFGIRLSCVMLLLVGQFGAAQVHQAASVSDEGVQGNGNSSRSSISADGRFVAFKSRSTDLVPAPDFNGNATDIFLHDRLYGITTRVSENADGDGANGESLWPRISADGNYVVFYSFATNLIPTGDLNGGLSDVFVWSRLTGELEMISYNLTTGNQGNDNSRWPEVSHDGRYVAFQTAASNMFSPDLNGNSYDALLFDRQFWTMERVSISSSGLQANNHTFGATPNADGKLVFFWTQATNLMPGGAPDLNGSSGDVFVRDRVAGTTELMSVNSGGVQGNGSSIVSAISPDGRFVAFNSRATNLDAGFDQNGSLNDAFLHDLQTGSTEVVSINDNGDWGDGHSYGPSVSNDGRYVAFYGAAANLAPKGDVNGSLLDVFVRDRNNGTTHLISATCNGDTGNEDSWEPRVTADAQLISFSTETSDLLNVDDNGHTWDVLATSWSATGDALADLLGLQDRVLVVQTADELFTDLLVKVDSALKLLQDRSLQNDQAVCGLLVALTNEVQAQAGKRLSESQAMGLMDGARLVQTGLGCGEGGC